MNKELVKQLKKEGWDQTRGTKTIIDEEEYVVPSLSLLIRSVSFKKILCIDNYHFQVWASDKPEEGIFTGSTLEDAMVRKWLFEKEVDSYFSKLK